VEGSILNKPRTLRTAGYVLCTVQSPATFQTMMDDIFDNLITEGVVVVYLDDILIFTETLKEHWRVTRRVMELLRKNNLFLKPKKCEFEKTEVPRSDYLPEFC